MYKFQCCLYQIDMWSVLWTESTGNNILYINTNVYELLVDFKITNADHNCLQCMIYCILVIVLYIVWSFLYLWWLFMPFSWSCVCQISTIWKWYNYLVGVAFFHKILNKIRRVSNCHNVVCLLSPTSCWMNRWIFCSKNLEVLMWCL